MSRAKLVRGKPRVRLVVAWNGPTAGYQGVVVQPAYDWEDGARDYDSDEIVRNGPWSDAGLVARSQAIEWAEKIGMPYEDT